MNDDSWFREFRINGERVLVSKLSDEDDLYIEHGAETDRLPVMDFDALIPKIRELIEHRE